MLPHADVHRWSDDDLLVGREQQCGRKVVGEPGGHLRQQVRGRRADEDEIGRAAELDMAHLDLVLELPQRRVDLALRKRAEAIGVTKCSPPLVSTGVTSCPAFLKQPDEFEGLVGGNPSADDQQYTRHERANAPDGALKSSANEKGGALADAASSHAESLDQLRDLGPDLPPVGEPASALSVGRRRCPIGSNRRCP